MNQYVIAAGLLLFASLSSAQTPVSDKAAMDKSLAAPIIGDADRGRLVFGSCRTCHLPDKGAGNHNGPNLYSVFGRKAGTREGFLYYSDEMKNAGFEWTPELLDLWLANPGGFLPNSTMIFPGVKDAQRRADLIEYLKSFHD